MRKRKRLAITITQVAIALVVVTTVIGMAASGSILFSGGRNFQEGVHAFSLVIMLIAYLFLIVVLMTNKPLPIRTLSIVEHEASLLVSPCRVTEYIVLDQAGVDRAVAGAFSKIRRRPRAAIRIVVARAVSIPESFLDSLLRFPNLAILDVQDSNVDSEFWNNLEELQSLSHVLATNAIPSNILRNMSIALPEVRFWLGHHRNLVICSAVTTNSGTS
jgi:hypothetical protein